jgi:predicted transcriptional regulator
MQKRHNITLDKDVSLELETVARELDEKKSKIIEKALTVYFDLLDVQVAKKRLRNMKKGRDTLLEAEKVWEDLKI